MKSLFQVLLLTLCLPAFGQSDSSYAMTTEQNKAWLEKVKNSDKKTQFELVKLRLIEHRQRIYVADGLDAPILIVDGIQISDFTQIEKDFLTTRLTSEIVDIEILEKEIMLGHSIYQGIIILTVKDKKLSKEFFKLGRKSRKKR